MRKLTTLFLGLILLTSCGENEVDSSKLVERGGLTYAGQLRDTLLDYQ